MANEPRTTSREQLLKSFEPPIRRVLLLDDDTSVLSLVSLYLEQYGYQVIPVKSAQEAFLKIQIEEIDVVITDVLMPEIDGFEFLKILHSGQFAPKTNNIPVIMLSSGGQEVAERYRADVRPDFFCEKENFESLLIQQLTTFFPANFH